MTFSDISQPAISCKAVCSRQIARFVEIALPGARLFFAERRAVCVGQYDGTIHRQCTVCHFMRDCTCVIQKARLVDVVKSCTFACLSILPLKDAPDSMSRHPANRLVRIWTEFVMCRRSIPLLHDRILGKLQQISIFCPMLSELRRSILTILYCTNSDGAPSLSYMK